MLSELEKQNMHLKGYKMNTKCGFTEGPKGSSILRNSPSYEKKIFAG
jgi:hypothetical protein